MFDMLEQVTAIRQLIEV